MEKKYIGDKLVLGVSKSDKKTPLGEEFVSVLFEDNSREEMPKKRYEVTATVEKSDATTLRKRIADEVAKNALAVFYEYGLKFNEAAFTVGHIAESINNAAQDATNYLWDVQYEDERTLNQINDVLLKKYEKNNGGTSSNGDGADKKDKK